MEFNLKYEQSSMREGRNAYSLLDCLLNVVKNRIFLCLLTTVLKAKNSVKTCMLSSSCPEGHKLTQAVLDKVEISANTQRFHIPLMSCNRNLKLENSRLSQQFTQKSQSAKITSFAWTGPSAACSSERCACAWQGVWKWKFFKVHSYSIYSMILIYTNIYTWKET